MELLISIMQLRQYQRTAAACDAAKDDGQIPEGRLADWYYEFQDEDWLNKLRNELAAMIQAGAPQSAIAEQQTHIDKFAAKMIETATERRNGRRD